MQSTIPAFLHQPFLFPHGPDPNFSRSAHRSQQSKRTLSKRRTNLHACGLGREQPHSVAHPDLKIRQTLIGAFDLYHNCTFPHAINHSRGRARGNGQARTRVEARSVYPANNGMTTSLGAIQDSSAKACKNHQLLTSQSAPDPAQAASFAQSQRRTARDQCGTTGY